MDRAPLPSRFLLLEVATRCQWSKTSQQLFPCNGHFSTRRQSCPLVRLIKTCKSCADSLPWPSEEQFEICPMRLRPCASESICRVSIEGPQPPRLVDHFAGWCWHVLSEGFSQFYTSSVVSCRRASRNKAFLDAAEQRGSATAIPPIDRRLFSLKFSAA